MLLELVELLVTKDRDVFDFNHWSCGTKACAAGWATTLKSFRDRGLVLVQQGRIHYAEEVSIGSGKVGRVAMRGTGLEPYCAMAEVLSLPIADMYMLFSPGILLPPSASAQRVANKIKTYAIKLLKECGND